jgi:hypothetical protein
MHAWYLSFHEHHHRITHLPSTSALYLREV